MFDDRENITKVLELLLEQGLLIKSNALMVITHEIHDRLMGILQMLSAGGLSIVIYVITDNNIEQYIRQGNSRLKVVVLPIEAELEELL